LLRSFSPSDADAVQQLAGNYNVAKMTLNVPHPYLPGMAEEWMSTHSRNWESRSAVTYAITSLKTAELIGAIGLVSIKNSQASLGYWIGEEYWGNGYCTEAGNSLVKFAFETLELSTIYAEHLSHNSASGKVMQNIGMKHCKTMKKPDREGSPATMELYTIRRRRHMYEGYS